MNTYFRTAMRPLAILLWTPVSVLNKFTTKSTCKCRLRVHGVREQRTIARHVQFSQLPRVLPVEHRLRPLHVHRRLRRDRRDHVCPVPPSSALQQPVSFNNQTGNAWQSPAVARPAQTCPQNSGLLDQSPPNFCEM